MTLAGHPAHPKHARRTPQHGQTVTDPVMPKEEDGHGHP
jgi:hypothetical protein